MADQTSGLVNLVFSRQTGFFKPEHPFIDKPIVITEPAVQSAWLLGMGSRLYPSNMQRVLNQRPYSIQAESISSAPKSRKRKKGSSGRVKCC